MAEVKSKKITKKEAVNKASKKSVKTDLKKAEVKTVDGQSGSKLNAPLFDLSGKKKGTIALPKELFAGKVNEKLVAQAIRVYLTNQRQGTSSTKTRSEVVGSRRKVWRQKGTGRARHGSITGPIFVGGGIIHGPKPRNFDLKMPKKMKLQALVSALTEKNNENMVFVFEGKLSGKTKEFTSMVKTIFGSEKKNSSVLLVRSKDDKGAFLASRNVNKINTVMGSSLNTYEVVKNNMVLISKEAMDEMKEVFVKA